MKNEATFDGIYWADDSVDKVVLLKKSFPNLNYVIETKASIMAFMAEEFNNISMLQLNLYPELVTNIYNYMADNDLGKALLANRKYLELADFNHFDWATLLKILNKFAASL